MPARVKSRREIEGIRRAGATCVAALREAGAKAKPGVSLRELAETLEGLIRREGAYPTFLGYRGFPAPACISINAEVVHGIPDSRVLVAGDLVKIDVGVTRDGFIADAARTFPVGTVSADLTTLVRVTEESFWLGAGQARAGNRISDISRAIQQHVEKHGYSVVRALCGHGVGLNLHEEPQVPNYVDRSRDEKLAAGMTLAIEPMVNIGGCEVDTLDDGWTVVARDGRPSAHYENTVLVTAREPEILTQDRQES